MNVVAFSMTLWTADVYQVEAGGHAELIATLEGLFRHLTLLCAAPVLYLLGWPLFENALEGVRRGVFSTDLLLGAGVAAAFAYSAVSVMRGAGPVYFEVGCVVLVMVTLGRWLEATGKLRANDALDRLARLMPDTVRRVRGALEESIPLADIATGDVLRVLAGERIPADGRIERGLAFVDEQILTGESAPRSRQAGDSVLGGTLNIDGDLFIAVSAAGSAGTLARLIELVRTARFTKGSYERLADRVSSWFVPIVTVIALLTFCAYDPLRLGTRPAARLGRRPHRLPVRARPGDAARGLVVARPRRRRGGLVPQRRRPRTAREHPRRPVRQDRHLDHRQPAIASIVCAEGDHPAAIARRASALAAASTHVLAQRSLSRREIVACRRSTFARSPVAASRERSKVSPSSAAAA